jgi:hypothetical protein
MGSIEDPFLSYIKEEEPPQDAISFTSPHGKALPSP